MLGRAWEEWEVPREAGDPWSESAAAAWKRLQAPQSDAQRTAALLTLNNALGRGYTLKMSPTSRATRGRRPDRPAPSLVGGAHRTAEGDRCIHRRQGGLRIPVRQAYEDRGIVRVAGPFTVESLAPHRTLGVNENDELIDHLAEAKTGYDVHQDFATIILEHLNTSGVQQAHREDRISFTALTRGPAT